MLIRRLSALSLSVLVLCVSCSTWHTADQPDRVLFVGNSLTYVGNFPAVFSALARANGHAVRSYMLVSPGGTLAERLEDGSAAKALEACRCTIMVLQERGGDLFGAFGRDATMRSVGAVMSLAQRGRAERARVFLMGTYNSRRVSSLVVDMEGTAAQDAGIPYIAVANRLWRLHDAYPSLQWRAEDAAHPGKALTLVDAVLLYRHLYGSFPAAKSFVVNAPIYGVNSGLKAVLRAANAPAPV